MSNKRKLGKGLAALLGEQALTSENSELKYLSVNLIEPNPLQPRKDFDPEKLYELAESIKHSGVLQPIIVYKNNEANKYIIVAGERRWRACQLVNIQEMPALIKQLTPKEYLEISLIENIQRQELSAIEESDSYMQLIDKHSYTQEQLSNIVGKSRSHIANLLRLHNLSDSIKIKMKQGLLTMGHARALIGITNAEELSEIIINKGLNVRQTERLVQNHQNPKKNLNIIKTSTKSISNYTDQENQNSDLNQIATFLSTKLGVKVSIQQEGQKRGTVILHFNNLTQFDSLLERLSTIETRTGH